MSTTNYSALLRNSVTQHPYYRTDQFGKRLRQPSQQYLDEVADKKFTAGYDIRKSNRCDVCFTFRSTSGSCNCE